MMTAQLSFYPLGSEDYLPAIDRVLALIADAGIEHRVGEMSTFLRGEREVVFALLARIADQMDANGCPYAMNLTLSNTCGID